MNKYRAERTEWNLEPREMEMSSNGQISMFMLKLKEQWLYIKEHMATMTG